jgi:hypothetical protein
MMAALRQGLRPLFAKTISSFLKGLIIQCWSADTGQRPTAAQILEELAENQNVVFPFVDNGKVEEYRRFVTSSLPSDTPVWTVRELIDDHFSPFALKRLTKKGIRNWQLLRDFIGRFSHCWSVISRQGSLQFQKLGL